MSVSTGDNLDAVTLNAAFASKSEAGGGGSLTWVEDALAPIADSENNMELYLYEAGGAQDLYAIVNVPSAFAAGSQITMRMSFYSPDSSGTALMSSESTLIRVGTDAASTTTNQHTSTNTAETLTVTDLVTTIILDLTDSSGAVNSVGVSAGDLLKVRLFRGTDTSTSEIRALVYAAEVKFS